MFDPLAWAALLLLIGLGLVILEVFVPSGGVIGFLSIVSVLSAISLAFYRGAWYGLSFLGAAVIALPIVLAAALRWWPETPMGRRVLLEAPTSEDVLPDSLQRRSLKALVGRIGEAKSLMLPSGSVLIDGLTVDALSEGVAIEKGQWVQVVEVRGTRVVVRPTDKPPSPPPAADETLSQPIDSLGLDPFEDPLA
ncbi:MAG TPA: NfeD family protein [Pirellulales bacterium]|nr:NfeD family protein [Pirellulales bacterium]